MRVYFTEWKFEEMENADKLVKLETASDRTTVNVTRRFNSLHRLLLSFNVDILLNNYKLLIDNFCTPFLAPN